MAAQLHKTSCAIGGTCGRVPMATLITAVPRLAFHRFVEIHTERNSDNHRDWPSSHRSASSHSRTLRRVVLFRHPRDAVQSTPVLRNWITFLSSDPDDDTGDDDDRQREQQERRGNSRRHR